MHTLKTLASLTCLLGLSTAACPYAHPEALGKRQDATPNGETQRDALLGQYEISDGEGTHMTSDVGGPIEEQGSLKAGPRGSTLMEDFIYRQKMQHFDHERVGPASPTVILCDGVSRIAGGGGLLTNACNRRRYPRELSMRGEPVRMVLSRVTVTLATSRLRRSWARPGRRRPCL